MKAEIRDSVLADIRNEIRSNFKTLVNSVPRTPLSFYRTPLASSAGTKRLRETDGDDDNASRRPAKAMCGVGTSTEDTNLVAPEREPEKFWLYLSGILPEVPEAKVTELVESKLKCTNLRMIKLVPPGKDTRSLNYVSCKIGMPLELKPIALATETWPRGIRFREFEDHGIKKQFFWRPEAMTPVSTVLTDTPKAPSNLHRQIQ